MTNKQKIYKHFQPIILVFTVIVSVVLVNPTHTYASYQSNQSSNTNSITASSLYFTVEDLVGAEIISSLVTGGVLPGIDVETSFVINKKGLLPFQYHLVAHDLTGFSALCSGLSLNVTIDGTSLYSSSLLNVESHTPVTITGGEDQVDITFSLLDSDALLRNGTCFFSLGIEAWQTESDGSWGFTDSDSFINIIESGNWPIPGDIVINEVMWMGSTVSTADEWIELRNLTGDYIHLQGSVLMNAGNVTTPAIVFPEDAILSAGDFYVVSNYDQTDSNSALSVPTDLVTSRIALDNTGEQLVFTDGIGTVIDSTPSGSWPAGVNDTTTPLKQSMERNSVPGDGTLMTSWHTCIDSGCNSSSFWETVGSNYGTPGSINLSSNDPTSTDFKGIDRGVVTRSNSGEDTSENLSTIKNKRATMKDESCANNRSSMIKEETAPACELRW